MNSIECVTKYIFHTQCFGKPNWFYEVKITLKPKTEKDIIRREYTNQYSSWKHTPTQNLTSSTIYKKDNTSWTNRDYLKNAVLV